MKIKAINKGSEAKALAFQEFLGFSDKDEVFIVNLEDGKRTPLFNSYIDRTAMAFHVSDKAYAKPG